MYESRWAEWEKKLGMGGKRMEKEGRRESEEENELSRVVPTYRRHGLDVFWGWVG